MGYNWLWKNIIFVGVKKVFKIASCFYDVFHFLNIINIFMLATLSLQSCGCLESGLRNFRNAQVDWRVCQGQLIGQMCVIFNIFESLNIVVLAPVNLLDFVFILHKQLRIILVSSSSYGTDMLWFLMKKIFILIRISILTLSTWIL